MAAAVPEPRRPSPNTAARETATLSVNLSSNNPFRNRAVSPGLLSVSPRSFDTTQNRMSRNPFLDVSDFPPAQPTSKEVNGLTADIFGDLSLLDGPANDAPPSRVAPRVPPPRSAAPPVNAPRPFGSEQRRDRPRDPMAPTGASTRLPTQRPRGLSASSVMGGQEHEGRKDRERSDRPPRTESEERKRRERRKERDERHKREKEKIRTGGRTKKPQGLDIIDKLDVTGIYGQGLFHHDGPFDACNPHRNVKKDRRAPMEAFPANSANMALGGAGPLNSHIDLDRFHGRGEEAFDTFGGTRKTEANIVDPTKRGEYVHGTESTGLGTSTFLDGAPASRRDITRRDSDDKPTGLAPGGGLSRKKSIAQRFRGMSNNRRGPGYETRSPEARYHQASNSNEDAIEVSPPTHKAISAGGPARAAKYNNENEVNPFDQDYENAYARKGAQIRIAEQERPSAQRNLSASSAIPTGSRLGLTRSITADSPRPGSNEGEKPSGGGGFLNRMKSLKGGRRTRPERPER